MNPILVIYDNEADYANSLLDYIKRSMKLHINVHAFTNNLKFKEYIQYNMIGLLLVNEKVNISELNHNNIRNVCILWEGETEDSSYSYPCIYKYQSAKSIIEQLIQKYPMILYNRQDIKDEHKYTIISVISLDHKKLQSRLAYQLSREYSELKKVLYINMHSWQIISTLYKLEHSIGVSEFIYYLRQKSPNLLIKFNDIVKKVDKLHCLFGTSFGMELNELTVEDMKLWMEQSRLWNQYDIILFDVGNVQPYVMELLLHSNRIIYTVVDDKDKIEQENFMKQLEYAGHKNMVDRITTLSLSSNISSTVENYISRNGGVNVSKDETSE